MFEHYYKNSIKIFLFFLIIFISCDDAIKKENKQKVIKCPAFSIHKEKQIFQFLKDPKLSDFYGVPTDDAVSSVPMSLFNNPRVKRDTAKSDSFALKKYSCFNEPILYNYYLGKEIYRFYFSSTFNSSYIFKIEKKDDDIYLYSIELMKKNEEGLDSITKRKIFRHTELDIFDCKCKKSWTKNFNWVSFELPMDSCIHSTKLKLSLKDWNTFIELLDKIKFWYLNPIFLPEQNIYLNENDELENIFYATGIDGNSWLIEAHTSKGYHAVERWLGGELLCIGDFFKNKLNIDKLE